MLEAKAEADFLSAHARATPDKTAVVDDRPYGTVQKVSFASNPGVPELGSSSRVSREAGGPLESEPPAARS